MTIPLRRIVDGYTQLFVTNYLLHVAIQYSIFSYEGCCLLSEPRIIYFVLLQLIFM